MTMGIKLMALTDSKSAMKKLQDLLKRIRVVQIFIILELRMMTEHGRLIREYTRQRSMLLRKMLQVPRPAIHL